MVLLGILLFLGRKMRQRRGMDGAEPGADQRRVDMAESRAELPGVDRHTELPVEIERESTMG
jgi:hypothetical protein